MLKKIKNLTKKELYSICNENMCYGKCPLELYNEHNGHRICMKNLFVYFKKDFKKKMKEKIEVENE